MSDTSALLNRVLDYVGEFAPEERASAWAFVGAPGVVLVLIMTWIAYGGNSPRYSQSVSIIPLRASIDRAAPDRPAQPYDGFIVLSASEGTTMNIPLESLGTDSQDSATVRFSIAPIDVRANQKRISIDDDNLYIELPLLGVTEPTAIVVQGTPPSSVSFPGRRVPLDALQLQGFKSEAMLTCAVLATMFSFGLTVSSNPVLRMLTSKQRRRKKRAGKYKD